MPFISTVPAFGDDDSSSSEKQATSSSIAQMVLTVLYAAVSKSTSAEFDQPFGADSSTACDSDSDATSCLDDASVETMSGIGQDSHQYCACHNDDPNFLGFIEDDAAFLSWQIVGARISQSFASCLQDLDVTEFADDSVDLVKSGQVKGRSAEIATEKLDTSSGEVGAHRLQPFAPSIGNAEVAKVAGLADEDVDVAAWAAAGARVYHCLALCVDDPEVKDFADGSLGFTAWSEAGSQVSLLGHGGSLSNGALGLVGARISRSLASCMVDPEVAAFTDGNMKFAEAGRLDAQVSLAAMDEKIDVVAFREVGVRISHAIASCLADPEMTKFLDEASDDVARCGDGIHVQANGANGEMGFMSDGEVDTHTTKCLAPRMEEHDAGQSRRVDQYAADVSWRVVGARLSHSIAACMDDPDVIAFAS